MIYHSSSNMLTFKKIHDTDITDTPYQQLKEKKDIKFKLCTVDVHPLPYYVHVPFSWGEDNISPLELVFLVSALPMNEGQVLHLKSCNVEMFINNDILLATTDLKEHDLHKVKAEHQVQNNFDKINMQRNQWHIVINLTYLP